MIGRLWCTIALVMVVGGGCASAPKTQSFPELPRHLDPGSTIRVTETGGATTTGTLSVLSPTSLTILVDDVSRDVPHERVTSIVQPQRQVGRGVLFGLLGGFGVGLVSARSGEPSGSSYVDAAAGAASLIGGMALGTGIGAIIGALVKVDRPIYQVPTGAVSQKPQARRLPVSTSREAPSR